MSGHWEVKLTLSFLFAFYSGLPGLWVAEILRKRNARFFFAVRNYELSKNAGIYKILGIDFFAYCVKNTFFRHLNTKIKITRRPDINEINNLLTEITISELCHIIGFVFVLIFQIIVLITHWYDVFLFLAIFNIIFNLYPVLLQERNKLRLRRFMS